ncbi:lysophosphatidic acid receptor 6-like [Scyliorhinus torazame]|uniref:lysophosphatidic acid receptor 6-like n=1 Tax=Scyliorhinus torazame TaxID=75743 RepID=UPI003B5B9BEC
MSDPNQTAEMNPNLSSAMNCTGGSTSNTVSDSVKQLQVIVNLITLVSGLGLNVVALWILCFKCKKWTVSAIYMINLIISDMLLLFSLPFRTYAYQTGTWSLGPGFCNFLESLYYVNMYASILIITLISVDRYLAIKHPFLARTFRSPKKTVIACTMVWIVVWSCCFYIYSTKTSQTCFFNHSPSFWKATTVAVLQSVFLVAALIMTFCSIQIIRALRRRGTPKAEDKSSSKTVNIILSNLLTFLVCFTPYHVGILLYFSARNCWVPGVYVVPLRNFLRVCLCLANVNCVLDGAYYYFVIHEFWKSSRGSLKAANGII